jgi:hypothetical protein
MLIIERKLLPHCQIWNRSTRPDFYQNRQGTIYLCGEGLREYFAILGGAPIWISLHTTPALNKYEVTYLNDGWLDPIALDGEPIELVSTIVLLLARLLKKHKRLYLQVSYEVK